MINKEKLLEKLNQPLKSEDWFIILSDISTLIEDNPELSRELVINLLDNKEKIPDDYKEMFSDILGELGFYPYLEKEKNILNLDYKLKLHKSLYKSKNIPDIFFHSKQAEINNLIFNTDRNIILSAPTSFGKSLLIHEIIASKKYNNIVIIQPTLALLSETRDKLKKYGSDYNIVVRTSQESIPDGRNLLLLTAERFIEYQDKPKNIDLFILDEFYKISPWADKERFHALNIATLNLLKEYNSRFYFIGPFIDKVSDKFLADFSPVVISTNYTLVDAKINYLYKNEEQKEFFAARSRSEKKKEMLFDLLESLEDTQTIIYCSSSETAYKLAREFYTNLAEKSKFKTVNVPLNQWIESQTTDTIRNYSWDVNRFLTSGIAIHNGALPRHMLDSIINYFNEGKLKYLFCTSTIIEGVNTSAKNIVIYSGVKGRSDLTFFDYSNIKGRAGRMMQHYVGNLYSFVKPPVKDDDVDVDVPFSDQENADKEILIHLEEEDVLDKNSDDFKYLETLPEEEKELFKRNSLSVEGQKKILEIMRADLDSYIWSGIPSYNDLESVIKLAWENLLNKSETGPGAYSYKQLTLLIWKYHKTGYNWFKWRSVVEKNIYSKYKDKENKKINLTIPSSEEIYNESIRASYHSIRHWFEYKVPKWISVINDIHKYVAEEKNVKGGDYSYFAGVIERAGVDESLLILLDYGVPTTAIHKLKSRVPQGMNSKYIIGWLRRNRIFLRDWGLIDYEIERINLIL